MSYGVISDAYLIKSPTDLPAPVGGIIDLPEERVILVDRRSELGIEVPTDTQIRVPSSSVLRGWDADANGLRGDVDAPLIIGEDDGIVVTDLFIRNFSAGANAYCVEATNGFNPIGRASRVVRCSVGGTGGVLVRDATAVQLNILSRCTRDGVVLLGNTGGVQLLDCVWQPPPGATPDNFVLDAGSHNALQLNNGLFALGPGAVGILARNLPTLNLVRIGETNFVPTVAPPITPVAGNIAPGVPLGSDTQSDVLFLGNFGISDSSFGGAMSIPTNPNQFTDIPAQSTFVRIGNNNLNHPLFVAQNPTARFAVVGAQAQNQVLTYTGPEVFTTDVFATLSIRQASIYQLQASARIVKLPISTGIPEVLNTVSGVLADGFSGGGAVGEITVTAPRIMLDPGDSLYLEIANDTNTPGNPLTDLSVSNVVLNFSG